MKIPRAPHRWAVTPKQAIAIQRHLASRVKHSRPRGRIRLVAGVDAAFSIDGKRCIAGVVLWDIGECEVLEERVAVREVRFPYVPGLLSFREAPVVIAVLRKLRAEPDAIMCDGHGVAHPRRFGLASHVGIICRRPTIGCAKSRLVGAYGALGTKRGGQAALSHDGVTIGTVLRTQGGVNPVFVSVGHKIDLRTAERTVLECAVRYRLPEPTRLADHLVGGEKSKIR